VIIQLLMTLGVGATAGWTLGFLMRDGRKQSPWILVAGVIGATLAAGAAEWAGSRGGVAIALITALAGALLTSFGTRLAIFAREA
jgi:hypothetical protein